MLYLLKLYFFSHNFTPCRHFWSVRFMSCNFMSCKSVRHFHVLHFQSTHMLYKAEKFRQYLSDPKKKKSGCAYTIVLVFAFWWIVPMSPGTDKILSRIGSIIIKNSNSYAYSMYCRPIHFLHLGCCKNALWTGFVFLEHGIIISIKICAINSDWWHSTKAFKKCGKYDGLLNRKLTVLCRRPIISHPHFIVIC